MPTATIPFEAKGIRDKRLFFSAKLSPAAGLACRSAVFREPKTGDRLWLDEAWRVAYPHLDGESRRRFLAISLSEHHSHKGSIPCPATRRLTQ